jgi:hypothetical protein
VRGVALCEDDNLEDKSRSEEGVIEAVLQFDHKAVTEENADCEEDEYLATVSEARGAAQISGQFTQAQPERPVTANLVQLADIL